MINRIQGKRVLSIKDRIEAKFTSSNWEEIGLLAGITDLVRGHSRLLRSLDWRDPDYAGNIIEILTDAQKRHPDVLDVFEEYLDEHFDTEGFHVSARVKANKITFSPEVFEAPPPAIQEDLVSVMMPFDAGFTPVYRAIQSAAATAGMQCSRADDFWEESVVVQDIFNLIFRSQIVVVDFTGKNPNVMYETGIAHTLGKKVVPLTQVIDHIPFDLRHHRALTYHSNSQGLEKLTSDLSARLRNLKSN
jgi:hypothetical protein